MKRKGGLNNNDVSGREALLFLLKNTTFWN